MACVCGRLDVVVNTWALEAVCGSHANRFALLVRQTCVIRKRLLDFQ
jgi:hypothetical protein